MDRGQKVNRISVDIDKDDFTTISLYKTNNLLGVIECENLNIPSFSQSGASRMAYQLFVRDYIINLLDNGGIEGFYYVKKQESDSVKYDNSIFMQKTKEYIENLLGDEYKFRITQDYNIESEKYKNGYIKNATAKFPLTIMKGSDIIKCKLLCNIKSGQMCKPKSILYSDEEFSFNITSIRKIFKNNH